MQEVENNEPTKDVFNYHAINILELMGIVDPEQLEIDLIETELKQIFANGRNNT